MSAATTEQPPPARGSLGEVALLFLKLGCIAFGGPAAHIALLRDEVVRRRRWVTEQQFLDLVGASNLIPGPTSTELAIFLGYLRAGWRGLVLAGGLFVAPAMLIVLVLAWAYVEFGSTPGATWLLYGVKPVIIAVVAQAIWSLGRTAVKGWLLAVVGLAALALYYLGFGVIVPLFGAGIAVALIHNARRLRTSGTAVLALLALGVTGDGPAVGALAAAAPFTLFGLFLVFLKIGATLYGGGYVLLAFLRADLVDGLGWLTDRQLIDAVAVGQFTPGPLFTTATFVGYLLGGVPGALVATLGIFLPSFVFVAVVYPLVPRLRRSPWTSAFLDGANVAAVGLMAAVAWQLGRAAIVDVPAAALALVAAALLIRFRVNSAWLVLGGGALGVLYHVIAT